MCNGAGAAGIACLDLIKAVGSGTNVCAMRHQTSIGASGRHEPVEVAHASTPLRTLEDALKDADIVLGLSVKGRPGNENGNGARSDHFRYGESIEITLKRQRGPATT